MRPKPILLTATSTEQEKQLGPALKGVMIKNYGGVDVLVDFDNPITANSYLLEAGETLTINDAFIDLHYKTTSGTSSLYLIRVTQ